MKLALIALLASPAAAATLPAIQIYECRTVTHGDLRPASWHRTECEWPGAPINPFPYDIMADVKGYETPAQETGVPILPVGRSPQTAVVARATGGAGARGAGSFHALSTLVSPFYQNVNTFSKHVNHGHTSDGCCDPEGPAVFPPAPPPSPVPLPAAGWLLVAAVGMLWRARG